MHAGKQEEAGGSQQKAGGGDCRCKSGSCIRSTSLPASSPTLLPLDFLSRFIKEFLSKTVFCSRFRGITELILGWWPMAPRSKIATGKTCPVLLLFFPW